MLPGLLQKPSRQPRQLRLALPSSVKWPPRKVRRRRQMRQAGHLGRRLPRQT